MALTKNQLQTLKTAILAETDPVVVTARAIRDDQALVNWYNKATTNRAWSESADARTLDEGADYSIFDNIVAGKRDAWDLFLRYAPRDMSKARNRKVVTDIWGNATSGSIAEAILTASTVFATNFEMVFIGAQASTGTVTAYKRGLLGPTNLYDISNALSS